PTLTPMPGSLNKSFVAQTVTALSGEITSPADIPHEAVRRDQRIANPAVDHPHPGDQRVPAVTPDEGFNRHMQEPDEARLDVTADDSDRTCGKLYTLQTDCHR
ncbi:MAG: hypothetical protein AABY89_06400, partial [Acidobacteriota bacterium]